MVKVGELISSAKSAKGFTIVELLIVIVVIGILAAIVIVAFNGIQDQAKETAFMNDLKNMAKKLEIAKVNNNGIYPFPLTTATDIHVNKSLFHTTENNFYYCRNSATNTYIVSARDAKRVQYKMVNGEITTHSSLLYGDSTCSVIGAGAWGGTNGNLGFDFNNGTGWAAWVQN